MLMLEEVERLGHKQFGGTLPAEALARTRTGVELPGDPVTMTQSDTTGKAAGI